MHADRSDRGPLRRVDLQAVVAQQSGEAFGVSRMFGGQHEPWFLGGKQVGHVALEEQPAGTDHDQVVADLFDFGQ